MKSSALKILILILAFNYTLSDASVLSYKKDINGLIFILDKGLMKIKVCENNIIEVQYTILPAFPSKISLVIKNKWEKKTDYTVSETPSEIIITTDKLKIKTNKLRNSIIYTDLQDNIILSENETDNKKMRDTTIAGIKTYICETMFDSPADEALFGLGCHPEDTLSINYKGRNQEMAIRYMTGAIPVLLSNKGYGLMWDNYSASNFYGTEAGNTKFKYVSESGNMVDYYFIYGPEFDRIVASYRIATGTAPMFPKWAFGLFQSQDRYKSQAEVLSVKDNYRSNKIPVDCIVQDWFY